MTRAVATGVLATGLLAGLVAGCTGSAGPAPRPGGPSAVASASSSSASPSAVPGAPSATPSAVRSGPSVPTVRLSATHVAGVRIGTEARAAERALRARLGPPRTEPIPSCPGERGRLLSWDTLTVILSDGADGGPVTLYGWSVERGRSRFAYALPYGVALGTTARRAVRQIPGGTGIAGEGQFAGSYLVYTRRVEQLRWLSLHTTTDRGPVDLVAYRSATCD